MRSGHTPSRVARVNAFLGRFKNRGLIEDRGGVLYVTPKLCRVTGAGDVLNETGVVAVQRLG